MSQVWRKLIVGALLVTSTVVYSGTGAGVPVAEARCISGTPSTISNGSYNASETARPGSCEQNPNFYSGAYRSVNGGQAYVVYSNLPNGSVTTSVTTSTSWVNAPTIQDTDRNAPVRLCSATPSFPICSTLYTNTGF